MHVIRPSGVFRETPEGWLVSGHSTRRSRDMTTELKTLDQQIIARYVGQPERLPADLRRELETPAHGPVQLYALADLDYASNLATSWLALMGRHVAVAKPRAAGGR